MLRDGQEGPRNRKAAAGEIGSERRRETQRGMTRVG